MEEKKVKPRFNKSPLLGAVIVLICALAGGYYIYKERQDKSSKNTATESWKEYRNEKYGLKFTYPEKWGKAEVKEQVADTGRKYSIIFNQASHSNDSKQIGIELDTDDYEKEVCQTSNKCNSLKGLNQSVIEKVLRGDKSGLANYDGRSYTVVLSNPDQGLRSGLDYYQILNLNLLNVSAAHAIYYIPGTDKGCVPGKISPDLNSKCVSLRDYEYVQKVINSIAIL